jgi:SAM-dependent methyltransferase
MRDPELERVKAVYRDRVRRGLAARYSLLRPGELFMAQERERNILHLLRLEGIDDLTSLRILEVGCGRGLPLVDWIRWGATPHNLAGVDVMESFLHEASAIAPLICFAAASGSGLPFGDGAFDVVTQFTVFSSILDDAMRRSVAVEMLRVTRPGGGILWYDVRIGNPTNPNLRAIGRNEIRRLFPGCAISMVSSTLAPPLARCLAPWSFLACAALGAIPFLRTHYAVFIRKVGT